MSTTDTLVIIAGLMILAASLVTNYRSEAFESVTPAHQVSNTKDLTVTGVLDAPVTEVWNIDCYRIRLHDGPGD
jgi:hypothetical protein